MAPQSNNNRRRNGRNNNRRNNQKTSSNSSRNRSNQEDSSKILKVEYDPPFIVGKKWEPKKHYKMKVQHPHLPGQNDTVQFPVINEETMMSDRAQFNDILVDLQDAVGLDGDNGDLLYYNYGRCLEGQSLVDWKGILAARDAHPDPAAQGQPDVEPNNARSPANFSEDVDTWITCHESRDFAELLQNQCAYMNRLTKPRKQAPMTSKVKF